MRRTASSLLPWVPILAALSGLLTAPAQATVPAPIPLYDRAMATVKEHFHDKTFGGQPFAEIVAAGRRELESKGDQLAPIVGAVFGKLAPTAPLLATEDDQLYWTLRNASTRKLQGAPVRHIGAWFERRGKRWFISEVFLGTPAAEAGLIRGDEVVTIDGKPFDPVRTFRLAPASSKLTLAVRRIPWEEPRQIAVGTITESFHATMERSMRRAFRVIEAGGKRIAYLPLPAATHDELRTTFSDLAARAEAQADGLVLDLRGNFGALDLTYEEVLFSNGKRPAIFSKPLVVLVDCQTSSGKEWLARLIQSQKRGMVVGERTPGAWRIGRLVDMTPDSALLYLAAAEDARERPAGPVDGIGIVPDQVVEQSLMYAAGEDAPLKAALAAVGKR